MNNIYDISPIRQFLQQHLAFDQWEYDAFLFKHNWFRTGGKADVLVQIKTIPQWMELASFLLEQKIPYRFLGGGSNILISAQGFRGFLLKWSTPELLFAENFTDWWKENAGWFDDQSCQIFSQYLLSIPKISNAPKENYFYASAGLPLSQFHSQIIAKGVAGFEPFSAIPAQIGGAIVTNMHGKDLTQAQSKVVEMGDFILAVFYWDPASPQKIQARLQHDCQFSYDYCNFQKNPEQVVVGALFRYQQGEPQSIRQKIQEITKIKVAGQEYGGHTAGCAFQNYCDPQGKRQSTGKLLEELGFKGRRIGHAMVSAKHANFVVNTHPACKNINALLQIKDEAQALKTLNELSDVANQVKQLISEIKLEVQAKKGLHLHEEIHYLGEF